MEMKKEKATFAAGCFWGVEKAFGEIPGVIETQVGYVGGSKENPSYRDVCGGNTGHAEAVKVEYNPDILSYEKLLEIFWMIHDPTQKNRQGPDVGSQYRSVIFYHNEEQKKLADKSKADLINSGKYKNPIATQIEPAQKFWGAEDYHQKYLMKNKRCCDA